ncbi:MAG: PAS domain S-box protein [Acidobacteria bacterium]|nr:PAS domain S-box protein [Acidobacteriota bacterium]
MLNYSFWMVGGGVIAVMLVLSGALVFWRRIGNQDDTEESFESRTLKKLHSVVSRPPLESLGNYPVLKLVVLYLVIGATWILLSDRLISGLVRDPELLSQLQTYKGWFYVSVTALLLGGLTRRYLNQLTLSERELYENRNFLAGIIESALDGIIIVDQQRGIVLLNRAAESLFGHTTTELFGKPLTHLVPDDAHLTTDPSLPGAASAGPEHLRLGKVYITSAVRSTGEWFPIEASISQVKIGRRVVFTVIVRDITERKRVQEEIQRFVSGNPVVIYALTIEPEHPRTIWVSKNVVDITGYTLAEAMADDWWKRNIHPEDQERTEKNLQDVHSTGHQISEYRFRRKDGSYFWVRDESRLLRDEQGTPTEIVGSWSDITGRIELEDQLRQSQKMEAIGKLAGGVAHDFNNLLMVIIGYSDLVLGRLPGTDPKRTYVADIKQAGEKAAALTRQLLAFSRKQILEPKILDLNEIVTNIEKMLRRLIGEDIVLTSVLKPALGKVKVDPGQIEQVIINLAVNARDAMPDGGRLTIETSMVEFSEEYGRLHPDYQPGWYVLLSLTDTGCGMTAEVKNRIFEPFFTTKAQGKGTGLGLATVFGILKQSEGHIEVNSEVGFGTCFNIYLPVIEEKWKPETGSDTMELLRPGYESILLVEDEPIVREVTKQSLEVFGYQVKEAGNGQEALGLIKTISEPIALLITDVVMPQMNGRQLAEQLRLQFPDLKVLFISGYTDDAIVRHGIIDANVAFLQKPFTPTALAKKVREVLEGKQNEECG